MELELKKIGKWDAMVFNDIIEKQITITWAKKGGAIVSGKTYTEAESNFLEAMNIAEIVMDYMLLNKYRLFMPRQN